MSVENLTGPRHPDKRKGEIVRHGSQPGTVTLSNRKIKVERPAFGERAKHYFAGPST